jgi:aspartate-semialdehyde dehydrogenase
MKIAIIGATGVVGRKMIEVLEKFNIKPDELILAASPASKGKLIDFYNEKITVYTIEEALLKRPDIALFSAGSDISKQWALKFSAEACYVIDNSSAWRMEKDIPLIVPEINGNILTSKTRLISNPNCSTIQLVQVLFPLNQLYGVKRVVVSTYQSVTGSGKKGIQQLHDERKGLSSNLAYPHPIDLNVLPHGGDFLASGYTTEEMKLIQESRKILSLPDLKITSTVVRVPVEGGHSESVNISFEKPILIEEIKKVLCNTQGIIVQDNPLHNLYPMPIFAKDKDDTFVGRIRLDESEENAINLWIVSDNLRKGAATNSVQIAQYIINKGFLE